MLCNARVECCALIRRDICRFYTLTLDHSYDQIIQQKACDKMLSIVTTQGNVHAHPQNIALWRHRPDGDPHDAELTDSQVRARVVRDKADALCMRQSGIRSSRRRWQDLYNLAAKDKLPVGRVICGACGELYNIGESAKALVGAQSVLHHHELLFSTG